MKNRPIISFVGLTHLGLNYLAAASKKNFQIYGFDTNKLKVKNLNNGIIEYDEPGLKTLIKKNEKKIFFSDDFKKLKKSKLVFISKDVSTDKGNNSDLKSLKKLINFTIKFIGKKTKLIILSQSRPGFVRSIKYDHNNLYHQVETLVFGNAINRAVKPERFIIGVKDESKKIDSDYLKYLRTFKCPIFKMNYESAEITKISINLILASTITTSNILSELCESNKANWRDVIPAIKLDKRIGKFSYINPGLGISGGNIERDIVTTIKLTKNKTPSNILLKSLIQNSRYMKDWVYRIIKKNRLLNLDKKNSIGIIGATYKENTNSMKNSPFLELVKKINKLNKIFVFEPKIKINFKKRNVIQINNLNEFFSKNKVIVFLRPFGNIKIFEPYLRIIKNKIVIDPYGVLKEKSIIKEIKKYYTLGTI